MARERFFLFAVNGGMVSKLSLARTDLQRMRLTAEVFENAFPRVIGPMQLRGGLQYGGQTKNNLKAKQIPFIFSASDTALIELTDLSMRPLINRTEIQRLAVATTIQNGDFASSVGWTLATTGGGISTIASSVLTLKTPVRGGSASASVSSAVAFADKTIEHALRLVVQKGNVRLRIGTTSGGQEILAETSYAVGTHSLVFTPNASTIFFKLSSKAETSTVVSKLQIEGPGPLDLATPWTEATLSQIRFDQSGDVIFATDGVKTPQRIERRGNPKSWSVVPYQFRNGPFVNKTADVKLTPSVRLGDGTLTASAPFFSPSHVGALFEISHTQTTCDVSLAGDNQFTDPVRTSGRNDGAQRTVTWATSGTFIGSYVVQVSEDNQETWQTRDTYTVNTGTSYPYGTENVVTYTRIGILSGQYTSGTLNVALSVGSGGGTGIVRVTKYISPTQVEMEVVQRLHHTGATEEWREGKYSDLRGWPSSVVLFEGRLWWGGKDQLAGSVSDDFSNFDLDEQGDSAPIVRSIATGPVNKVQWMLGLARLIIGTSGAESVARSSSFDEPMTATNFSIKDASTFGSADVQGVKIDRSGVYVQRSGNRAYVLAYSVDANDYTSSELTRYNPTILAPGVNVLAVQRQPDTRIWFGMDDGRAAYLVYEPSEDVISWGQFITDGIIEDIVTLPNIEADDVFMIVNRTINGVTKRYRERLAYDTEARGGATNIMADSCIITTLAASNIISGLSHLEGKQVVVWAAGFPVLDTNDDPALFTVSGGSITLPITYSGIAVVGLYYEGRWKSTKLAYAAQTGTPMSQKGSIMGVAPILYSTHSKGVLFGVTFDAMDPIPRMIEGEDVGTNAMLDDYDYDAFSLPGHWSNDSRLCMKMRAPMPATVLGVGILMEKHENA